MCKGAAVRVVDEDPTLLRETSASQPTAGGPGLSHWRGEADGFVHQVPAPGVAQPRTTGGLENHFLWSDICKCSLRVESIEVYFEVDSGASVSVMSFAQFKRLFPMIPLEPSPLTLKSASGRDLKVVGQVWVWVESPAKRENLKLFVVESDLKVPLLGRSWLDVLLPSWRGMLKINQVNASEESLRAMYPSVFDGERTAKISSFKAHIKLKEGCVPIFRRAYDVPLKIRDKVKMELGKLVEAGIFEPIRHSEWASPLVIVPKKNGELRLCVDYKNTVNTIIERDKYPLPRLDDILTGLSGGRVFVTLDLSRAFMQLEVSEESKEPLTVNTMFGLYRVHRLPYGVSSAPSIFQGVMDSILQGLEGVYCYIDDVVIVGGSFDECKERTCLVLDRLNRHGIRVNSDKCDFFKQNIMYLGHFIDESGIRPAEGKMKAIAECPTPVNVQQLKSFLGMFNFYGKFIPMSSTLLSPLYRLTQKNAPFLWSKEQESAFCRSKELLLNSNVLTFYQPQLPLVLITDASPYGVGAVLCHVIDGVEKPIWCASATLTPAEKNYAQIEREALAIVFGVRRFHKFLYGQQFTIVTDAQVLKRILGPKVGIPTLAASRLQRWALILASYDYDVVYRKNVENADMLSRLPLPMETTGDVECVFQIEGPLDNEDIIAQSKVDKVLQKVMQFTQAGWPKCCEEGLKPYFVRRHELTVSEGCLCWGNRVIVPRVLRGKVLQMLHEQHIGIVRMKLLARQMVWWPGVEKDIEDVIVNCETCLVTQARVPQHKYLVPWPETVQPWERVHLDLLSFQGHHILVLVDSYSKWMEAWLMEGTSAQMVILKLRTFMAVFGIPQEIVSDNGPPFQSAEFTLFCKQNNIKVTKSPPYHPPSNGLAERGVRTIKDNLAKQHVDMLNSHLRGDLVNQSKPVIEHHLINFLISYRNTPSSVTSVSPASLIFKHQPRTPLSLLKPVRPPKHQSSRGGDSENSRSRHKGANNPRV
jgi:hypothetical protein